MGAAYSATVDPPWDATSWRRLARHALRADVAPEQLSWNVAAQDGLFGLPDVEQAPLRGTAPTVPSGFLGLAEAVLCHRDPQRHALLYRLLWRLAHGEPRLLERATDADVRRAEVLAKAVSRDTHKMKAFVRFREVGPPSQPSPASGGRGESAALLPPRARESTPLLLPPLAREGTPLLLAPLAREGTPLLLPPLAGEGTPLLLPPLAGDGTPLLLPPLAGEGRDGGEFIAWFEPEHFIVDRVAGFFQRRFAGMRWAILTPYRSVRWDRETLQFGDGARRGDAPAEDAREELWRTYYSHIFNPARVNPAMMQTEMPRKYWKNLPEAPLIPRLLDASAGRVQAMAEREAQAPRRRIPAPAPREETPLDDLDGLKLALKACRRCELFAPATQAVAGEGPKRARILVVGEQPGDKEDLTGRPFVGPAGELFDRALDELGVLRETLYLTNAVKHFRFEQRGKVRLHKNPALRHVTACAGWLEREIALVQPERIVCLGATAARAVFGADFRLTRQRGAWWPLGDGRLAMATLHPAAVLRAADREAVYQGFVRDLGLLRAA